MIPFCGDINSGLLLINGNTGEVIEWDEDDGLGDIVAASFSRYLEDYRNSLLGGQMEFLGDCGVIEKMAESKSNSAKSKK